MTGHEHPAASPFSGSFVTAYLDISSERDRLREALVSIVVRCEEGDPDTDWVPTIWRIAKDALQ